MYITPERPNRTRPCVTRFLPTPRLAFLFFQAHQGSQINPASHTLAITDRFVVMVVLVEVLNTMKGIMPAFTVVGEQLQPCKGLEQVGVPPVRLKFPCSSSAHPEIKQDPSSAHTVTLPRLTYPPFSSCAERARPVCFAEGECVWRRWGWGCCGASVWFFSPAKIGSS